MALPLIDTIPPFDLLHPTNHRDDLGKSENDETFQETAPRRNVSRSTPRVHRLIHLRQSHEITLLSAGETTRLIAVMLDVLAKQARLSGSHRGLMPLAGLASKLSPRIQALVAVLDEWQILWRLLGTFDIWMSVKGLLQEIAKRKNFEEKFDLALEAGQISSMACYYGFEGLAWLGYRGIFTLSPEGQTKFYRWSCRGWAGAMLLDNIRAIIERYRAQRTGNADDEWKAQWRKVFLRNLAWALVAANLGVEGGFLPDILAAAFGAYASLSETRDLWMAEI